MINEEINKSVLIFKIYIIIFIITTCCIMLDAYYKFITNKSIGIILLFICFSSLHKIVFSVSGVD